MDLSLKLLDWGVILGLTSGIILWRLYVGSSITTKASGAALFGGTFLGISIYLFQLYREQ